MISARRAARVLVAATLALVLAAAVLGACGDDGTGSEPEAQPAPDVTTFAQGDFGEIPIVPDARTASERTEEGDPQTGTTVQSFLVADVPPREVISFYEEALAEDWILLSGPETIGSESWKAEWQFRERVLTITATPDPTSSGAVAGQQDILTQFSLHLHAED